MAKFKVGDKVRVIKNTADEFEGVKIGDIGKVIDICDSGDYQIFLRINKHDEYGFKEKELELVEENKMEKTFREVIRDIKEGEVWVNKKLELKITFKENEFYIGDSKDNEVNGYVGQFINNNLMFKLQRKEYTFEEAFKAYEECKEIESIKYKYKKQHGKDCFCLNREEDRWIECEDGFEIHLDEIRNRWYIND